MAFDPTRLDDERAQRVLVELYELLPGDARPDYDELASRLDDLRDDCAADVARPLGRLDDNAALRGAFARQALARLCTVQPLQPLLASALERAGRAHMAALPELVAGVLVLMAMLPSHIEKDAKGGFTIQWNQLQNLAALVKPVADLVRALPKPLLDKLG